MFSIPPLYLISLLAFALGASASQPSLANLEVREQGAWTNAYCIPSSQDRSAATVARCPSWAPIACTAISEPGYCCNPSTYCARASDGSIGCCAWGSTCAPVLGGAGAAPQQSTWQPTTWQQPTTQISTVYATQTHPYVVGGQDSQPQTTTVYGGLIGQGQGQQGQQQYCSTLYAHGPNLPTTEAGTCGTILIANAATPGVGGKRWMVLGVWLLGMVVGGIV